MSCPGLIDESIGLVRGLDDRRTPVRRLQAIGASILFVLMFLLSLSLASGRETPDKSVEMLSGMVATANRHLAEGDTAKAVEIYEATYRLAVKEYGLFNSLSFVSLITLSRFYAGLNNMQKADSLCEEAMALLSFIGDRDDTLHAMAFYQKGELLHHERRLSEAVTFFKKSIAIRERQSPPNLHELYMCCIWLQSLYMQLREFPQAVKASERLLTMAERLYGPHAEETIRGIADLGGCYMAVGNFASAESVLVVVASDSVMSGAVSSKEFVRVLRALASVYRQQCKFAEAELVCKRALSTSKLAYGPQHEETVKVLRDYALLLKEAGRLAESKAVEQEADSIMARGH
jgi:tetratricopeptide (TPR) repeat protein